MQPLQFAAPIVGSKYHPGAADRLATLDHLAPLMLKRDPENKADASAIAIHDKTGPLGYIQRTQAEAIAKYMDDNGLAESPCRYLRPDKRANPMISAVLQPREGTKPENPRAVVGHNVKGPPVRSTLDVTRNLELAYADTEKNLAAILASARELPKEITNDGELDITAASVKILKGAADAIEESRKSEKEPYLRGGQAVDKFFAGMAERCAKASSVLMGRVTAFQRRKIAIEQEERDRIAAEEEARLDKLALAARKSGGNLDEAITVKMQMAGQEAITAAAMEAANAKIKPKTVTAGGSKVSSRTIHIVEITDMSKLSLEPLRPFLNESEVLEALKAWAKSTNYKVPLAGAKIETDIVGTVK